MDENGHRESESNTIISIPCRTSEFRIDDRNSVSTNTNKIRKEKGRFGLANAARGCICQRLGAQRVAGSRTLQDRNPHGSERGHRDSRIILEVHEYGYYCLAILFTWVFCSHFQLEERGEKRRRGQRSAARCKKGRACSQVAAVIPSQKKRQGRIFLLD